jgi:gluconate 2-dehydrogenase gamma chain
MSGFSRRDMIKGGALVGVASVVAPASDAVAQPVPDAPVPPEQANGVLRFFTSEEASFVAAAVDRLIPPDDRWPGAADAGVVEYIDRQLATGYGAGARMYLEGPWDPDAPPQQGYQLKFSPAELYRVAIEEVREQVKSSHGGRELIDLGGDEIDEVLSSLEHGDLELRSLPSAVFFETLLANTVEGYFADPVYGGNKNMDGWRMIGFPGAYAQYADLVDRHGYELKREPISIAGAAAPVSKNEG